MSEQSKADLAIDSPDHETLSEAAAQRQLQECSNGDDCLECGECKEARKRMLKTKNSNHR